MTELVVLSSDDRATLVILEQPQPVATAYELALVVQVDEGTAVVVTPDNAQPVVFEGGVQGPAGPVGPAGQGGIQTLSLPTSYALDAYTLVQYNGITLDYADKDTASDDTLGVLTTATVPLNFGTVQLSGQVTNPSWSLTAGAAVYLGSDGQVTSTPPTTGVIQEVGFALSSTSIMLRIQEPVYIQ